jgi:outer membrane protein OmpA-like peptidoglycan-associated protein
VLLPPPVIVPTRPPAPPPPIPIAADAAGAAEHLPDGLRITFGDASAELNPATESALRTLAHAAPADASFTLAAFALGTPEDPSTPRRLSLARALAARSVLIAEGIASVRIYVKALGSGRGVEDGPADRVDVIVTGTNPQARSTP